VHREKTIQAEKELQRLRSMAERQRISKETVSAARQSLEALRDVNPDTITHVDKRNLMAKLGMKVYPSEDARPYASLATFSFYFHIDTYPSNNKHRVAEAIEAVA